MGRKKILNGDLIYMFKKLPESKLIPDIVWTAQNQLNRMTQIKKELEEIKEDYTWNTVPRMIALLKTHWSDQELKDAGFLE